MKEKIRVKGDAVSTKPGMVLESVEPYDPNVLGEALGDSTPNADGTHSVTVRMLPFRGFCGSLRKKAG